ncbi:hypothetical protein [Streptomyces sp. NPDC005423]|uniref:hypothetical protein n=1 Tax=Streptomyces sp. NPDC005423 TaxID=3155343 RepID=UPI0033A59480
MVKTTRRRHARHRGPDTARPRVFFATALVQSIEIRRRRTLHDQGGKRRSTAIRHAGRPFRDQVIDASPAALDADEVVCVPGLEDSALINGLAEAELAFRTAARRGES